MLKRSNSPVKPLPSRISASFMAFVLAFGLSIPTPALALEPASSLGTLAESGIASALQNALENWDGTANTITVTADADGMTGTEVEKILSTFLETHGEYFFIEQTSHGFSYKDLGNGKITGNVTMELYVNGKFSRADFVNFKAKAEELANYVNAQSWSDEEKALYLHDYIVTHCQYGSLTAEGEATDNRMYTSYGAFIDGVAVCQGYSELYEYLLRLVHIESQVITSENINHAWNVLTIDGKTYYVDCTWDDPDNAWSDVYCRHTHFLRTETEMRTSSPSHDATDWKDASGDDAAGKFATDTTYSNAYWRDVVTAIPQVGRKAAYVHEGFGTMSATADVYVHDYSATPKPNVTGAGDAVLATLPAQWTSANEKNQTLSWYGNYTSLTTDGENFLASTPTTIQAITPAGVNSTARTLTTAEQATGQIYGIFYDKAKDDCLFWLRGTPNDATSTKAEVKTVTNTAPITSTTTKVSLSQSQTVYSGTSTLPTLTARYRNYALKEGTDYRVEYLDSTGKVIAAPTSAGTYTVRLIGIGSFSGTLAAGTFTIAKASNELWSDFSKVTKTYKRKKLKKAKTFALPLLQADFGEENAKWKISSGNKKSKKVLKLKGNKIQVKKKAKKGTYTIKLQASVPGTANYAAAKLAKPVTVKVKVK